MLNMRFREKTNAWPGFVDLFSNLVIILIFLLIVFVFLWTTTSVFNKNAGARKLAVLEHQRQQQAQQIAQMTADQEQAQQLLVAARNALENQEIQINNGEIQRKNLANAYEEKIAQMVSEQQLMRQQIEQMQIQMQSRIAELTTMLNHATSAKEEMMRIESERRDIQDDVMIRNGELTAKIEELNSEIARLNAALEAAEETARQQDVEYIEMSNRLNKALADKIAELNALGAYQSEFYKQIKLALGDERGIQQDGDRFIVSSDILFGSGSYKISPDGKKQIQILANVIKEFEKKIPDDVDWIIRVDGHTDNKAVIDGTPGYKNNMELSLLRATAVVNELIHDGVSKRRLIPSGFGELYPVAFGNTKSALQKNRRIELQLTNK
jgi:chemotaxis protein MotB